MPSVALVFLIAVNCGFQVEPLWNQELVLCAVMSPRIQVRVNKQQNPGSEGGEGIRSQQLLHLVR